MHQAISKNKIKIRKLQAIANAASSSFVDLGGVVLDRCEQSELQGREQCRADEKEPWSAPGSPGNYGAL
jgi:hypothetical protein